MSGRRRGGFICCDVYIPKVILLGWAGVVRGEDSGIYGSVPVGSYDEEFPRARRDAMVHA